MEGSTSHDAEVACFSPLTFISIDHRLPLPFTMLFGDVARKFSTYLASMAGLSGVSNPSVFSPGYVGNQDPLSAGSNLMLSDKLTIQPSVSIFFSYARDSELSKQLDTEGSNITVFAPTNRAVMALPHKP